MDAIFGSFSVRFEIGFTSQKLVFAYQFSKQYSPGFLVLLNIAEKQVFDYHVTLARDSPISVFVCFDSLSVQVKRKRNNLQHFWLDLTSR